MPNGTIQSMSSEQHHWLELLDALRLECDGMTRVVSSLLQRDGVAHSPMVGNLEVPSVGRIAQHYWIELGDGRRIDLRARMWLGDDPRVPHGIVLANHAHSHFTGRPIHFSPSPIVFWALTGRTIDDFPPAPFLRAIDASYAMLNAGVH